MWKSWVSCVEHPLGTCTKESFVIQLCYSPVPAQPNRKWLQMKSNQQYWCFNDARRFSSIDSVLAFDCRVFHPGPPIRPPDQRFISLLHAEPNWKKAHNLVFSSNWTSLLVPVYRQLGKLNYWQVHIHLPHTRGRYELFVCLPPNFIRREIWLGTKQRQCHVHIRPHSQRTAEAEVNPEEGGEIWKPVALIKLLNRTSQIPISGFCSVASVVQPQSTRLTFGFPQGAFCGGLLCFWPLRILWASASLCDRHDVPVEIQNSCNMV